MISNVKMITVSSKQLNMTYCMNNYLKLRSGDAHRIELTGETTDGINLIAILI